MSAQAREGRGGGLRGAFIFALLAAFALLSLVVVIVGAKSYRMINAMAEEAFVSRTGMSYLVGKVRAADEAGQMQIREENGTQVLELGQLIDGERYSTYIYCLDNEVREYFARADLAFSPEYGEKIFEASELTLSLAGGLLTIQIFDAEGNAHTSSLYLQAAKEDGT